MAVRLNKTITASWLSEKLDLRLIGSDFKISKVCSIDNLEPNCLSFFDSGKLPQVNKETLLINSSLLSQNKYISILHSSRPRLDYIRAIHIIEKFIGFKPIFKKPKIDESVIIGENCFIANDVKIGKGTIIGNNVVINNGVEIGEYCYIKSGAVIGEQGFGFEKDEMGTPIRMMHLGRVIIKNYVEIGSLSTICKGSINNTIIDDYVKVSDHVHISHNCKIGAKTLITAGVIIAGSCEIGRNVWIGIGACIREKIKIGENSFIGMGAVVVKDVSANEMHFGNPARKRENEI